MRLCLLSFIPCLLLNGSTLGQNGFLSSSAESDGEVLKTAFLPSDGAALVDFLAKRSQKTIDVEKVTPLLEQLKSNNKAERDKASGEIVKHGVIVKPMLRQIINNASSKDVIAQARECIKAIDDPEVTACVIRSIGRANPKGSIEALLTFLPFSSSEEQQEEIRSTLTRLAAQEGKANDVLIAALKDEHPLRRGTAAELVCKLGNNAQIEQVKELIKDPKPTVRLRAAMGLVERFDPDAVPTLVSLLDSLPPEQGKQCEDQLIEVAGELQVGLPQGDDVISQRLRKGLWGAWWNSIDADLLVAELQKRTPDGKERTEILGLIGKLNDKSADVREKAANQLGGMGLKALTLLRKAAANEEDAKGQAAARLITKLEKELPEALPAVAIRLLAMKKHPKIAETLLQHLPYAASPEISENVQQALPWVALRDESSWPTLVKALDDPIQIRRITAVRALAKLPDKRALARKLFKDSNPEARMRSAFALADEQDKEAVPVLIGILSTGTQDQAEEVEDYLKDLPGPKKPELALGTTVASRQKCQQAWDEWWKANGDSVKLAKKGLQRGVLGYTLIVENYNSTRGHGRVLELDRRGKVRWEITGLQYPLHAQVLRRNRVLICEQSRNRVVEMDYKGKILWSYTAPSPQYCKRLANGNTIVAHQNQMVEVDKGGKVVKTRNLPDHVYSYGAELLKNGDFVYVSSGLIYRCVDKNGKLKHSYTVPRSPLGGSRYPFITSNGHLLVSFYSERKVKEYDEKGKELREFTNISNPNVPNLTPNGNALVGSLNQRKVIEVDRKGKIVREFGGNLYPWKVFRR